MNEWMKYRKRGFAEMRPYVLGEDMTGISISQADIPASDGDMIARNPENHNDQWLVSKEFFDAAYEVM